jgi:hypothetical protein
VQNLELVKKQADEKYGLKDLLNNPWKLSTFLTNIDVWPEVWPKTMYPGNVLTEEYYHKS